MELENFSSDLENLELYEKAVYNAYPHLLASYYSSEPMLFPPKIMEVVNHILEKIRKKEIIRVIMKAPRGGGKSKTLSAIELIAWWIYDFDVVNLGGSLKQAKKVYSYLTEAFNSPRIKDQLEKSIQEETLKKKAIGLGKIIVVAASEKQTRSPHVGSQNRGGLLVIDEECEADANVVKSALPVVNTANPSGIIRASTFHKAFGTYQDCWDNAEAFGYAKFSWDIFDVAKKCEDDCENVNGKRCEVWRFCKGKAHNSEGWVGINEIRQACRESDEETFSVEFMGERPSSAGLVYGPALISRAIQIYPVKYFPNKYASIGVDWGFEGETAIVRIQEQEDGIKRVIDCHAFKHTLDSEIFDLIKNLALKWSIPVYADSSHKFQNESLKSMGAEVHEVSFNSMKDFGINNIKKALQDGLLQIHPQFDYLLEQLKNYRRNPLTGKPVKKRDHSVDATLCSMIHFTDRGVGIGLDRSGATVVDPFPERRYKTGY